MKRAKMLPIKTGLKVGARDKIYETGRAEHDRLEDLLGSVRRRTNERWARGAHVTLASKMSEKLATLSLEVFENPLGAWQFLTTSAIGLQGRIPMEVARTPEGLAEVTILLKRIDHGIAT
jgi:uncharacterized protein (DUF2384 family)